MKIPEKSLVDLEFDTVLSQVKTHCITPMGKEAIAAIKPSDNEQDIVEELTKVSGSHFLIMKIAYPITDSRIYLEK